MEKVLFWGAVQSLRICAGAWGRLLLVLASLVAEQGL